MSALNELRREVAELTKLLQSEEEKHGWTQEKLADLEDEIDELRIEKGFLDTSTLDKQMMFEKLSENWNTLTMSDIEAICP